MYEGMSIKSPATLSGFLGECPELFAIALGNSPRDLLALLKVSEISRGRVAGDLILMPSYLK